MNKIGSILLDEQPLVVVPKLAQILGLNEAIILQQIHYWINKGNEIHDGKSWVYNSVKEWQEQFCFMGEKTIRRVLDNLIEQGLLVKGNYNKRKFDRTTWYTIDYLVLEKVVATFAQKSKCIRSNCPNASGQIDQMTLGQIDQMDVDKLTQPIPETTKDYQRLLSREGDAPHPQTANGQSIFETGTLTPDEKEQMEKEFARSSFLRQTCQTDEQKMKLKDRILAGEFRDFVKPAYKERNPSAIQNKNATVSLTDEDVYAIFDNLTYDDL